MEKCSCKDASCITDVREITAACIFQEAVDEEQLSEMLEVSRHLNSTKSLKMYMVNISETPGILRTSKWYCDSKTGYILPRNSLVCDPFYREEGIKTDVNS